MEDRRVVTAGGPLSWIDLSLHVLRDLCGAEAAKKTADCAVVDTAPSTQTIYIPPGHLTASNPFVLEAEHAVRQAGDAPMTSTPLARALNVSERTLHRRIEEATGETPKYFQQQFDACAAEHGPLEGFQSVDLAFGLASIV
ncbi:hypothetical protein [Methylocystis echinoides]|uniref:HTH araC/xylS-type domain-containing protein n=1 Tax=Methylocystis echinoides TaxID=29468 RepID=A0A9W6LUB8_9HYPH|nr:hypothetical protein [Methylocystis echinoides]GLI95645.1 hypothetical protein LMG27198_46370 [Methylocystis echinoides]